MTATSNAGSGSASLHHYFHPRRVGGEISSRWRIRERLPSSCHHSGRRPHRSRGTTSIVVACSCFVDPDGDVHGVVAMMGGGRPGGGDRRGNATKDDRRQRRRRRTEGYDARVVRRIYSSIRRLATGRARRGGACRRLATGRARCGGARRRLANGGAQHSAWRQMPE